MNNNVKLLLMFLIIAGVFFYYSLMSPKQITMEGEQEVLKDAVEEIYDKKPIETAQIKTPEIRKDVITLSDTLSIPFETDLYKGIISSMSGSFSRFVLKNYDVKNDTVLNLLTDQNKVFQMKMLLGKKEMEFEDLNFTVVYSGDIFPLKNDIDSIVLEIKTDEYFVQRIFRFSRDSYIIEHSVNTNIDFDNIVYDFSTGLNITEENAKDDLNYFSVNMHSNNQLIRNKHKQLKDTLIISGNYDWGGLQTKYFFMGIIGKLNGFKAFGLENNRVGSFFSASSKDVEIYAGPIDYNILKELDNGMDKLPDFGWKWITPISKIILTIFSAIYGIVPNYGVVIIIFSLFFIILFSPLTLKSYSSMRKMQMVQPHIADLKKKYAKDPQKMNAETMNIYKKHGVNPFSGCLPLFIQMPVFFALYAVLRTTIELRHEPFILWIVDLSAKDPYYVLPILTGATMFISQKFTMTDSSQKMLMYMMPIMMTVFFLNFPSGIVLYWFVYNIFSIIQQIFIKKMTIKKEVKNGKEKNS